MKFLWSHRPWALKNLLHHQHVSVVAAELFHFPTFMLIKEFSDSGFTFEGPEALIEVSHRDNSSFFESDFNKMKYLITDENWSIIGRSGSLPVWKMMYPYLFLPDLQTWLTLERALWANVHVCWNDENWITSKSQHQPSWTKTRICSDQHLRIRPAVANVSL